MAANIFVPYEAQRNWMQAAMDATSPFEDCYLCLAKSSLSLPFTVTLEELLAIESTFPGYERKKLEGWTPPFAGTGGEATTVADTVEFDATEPYPENVYGVFAINLAADKAWFVGNFTSHVPVPSEAPLVVSISLIFYTTIP